MLPFAPSPRYRFYTYPNSYLSFVTDLLAGQIQVGIDDIKLFEKKLCEKLKIQYSICVPQNRVGIYLVIKALVKAGQEVILSPFTIPDVINMVIYAGARPVFADIERETCNISAVEVERLINSNTGAVLITHLFGLAAEAHRIKEICDRFKVPMIEDCAQALGAKEQGKPLGTIGDVGIYSFGKYKNLNTWIGGAIVTNRDDVIEKVNLELEHFSPPSLKRIFGQVRSGLIREIATFPALYKLFTYWVVRLAYLKNIQPVHQKVIHRPQTSFSQTFPDHYKIQFSPFQARLGLSQLDKVDLHSAARIEKGLLYHHSLNELKELTLAPARNDRSHIYTYFPIQYKKRDELIRFMMKNYRDIAAQNYANEADSNRFREFYRDCPNARRVSQELFFLPTYPRYPLSDVDKDIQTIYKYFGKA